MQSYYFPPNVLTLQGINCGRAYFFISDRVFRRGGVILIVRMVAEAAYGMPDPLRSSPFEPTEIRMPME